MTGTWRDDARCRTVGIGIFFHSATSKAATACDREAKSVCQYCPVRQPCLDEAMAREGSRPTEERGGIWGGLTPRERHLLDRRNRKKAAANT
jgi:WhiB family redox-sensing transcriptional regulator